MSDEEKIVEKIGRKIRDLLNPEYTLSRFIKDAEQGMKARRKNREKARAYWANKEKKIYDCSDEDEKPKVKPEEEEKPEEQPSEPVKEESISQESEKPRRPSLINLAELQAKFHEGLKQEPTLFKIPTIITKTKKS